ncbi:glycosyltransferase family 2 protein [Poriferisphaera sp. WC338]|uniref:glycosyltransferase family 2 protein n=1 Tax=Poriferisphaera sp. WC338 TaxID=3425129 RepID=UPI003D814B42
MAMPQISICICSMNAADTIGATCASVKDWADEIVVIDSGSTDDTVKIAEGYGARIVHQEWLGYAEQKIFAMPLMKNDWVLIVDSDEEVSPELAKEIQRFTDEQLAGLDLVYMPRHNWVMGRYVRAWSPDWQSRLIHRDRVSWPKEALHDARVPNDPSRTMRLSGWLEHKRVSAADFEDYFSGRRHDERLMMVAQQMYDRGKRANVTHLVLRPWVAFFKYYVLKRGFLDGTFGLMIAQKAALSVQLKYAALWAIEHQDALKGG